MHFCDECETNPVARSGEVCEQCAEDLSALEADAAWEAAEERQAMLEQGWL